MEKQKIHAYSYEYSCFGFSFSSVFVPKVSREFERWECVSISLRFSVNNEEEETRIRIRISSSVGAFELVFLLQRWTLSDNYRPRRENEAPIPQIV